MDSAIRDSMPIAPTFRRPTLAPGTFQVPFPLSIGSIGGIRWAGFDMREPDGKPSDRGHYDRSNGGTGKLFGDIANRTSQAAGRALTFMIATGVVVVWAVTGPIFHYS